MKSDLDKLRAIIEASKKLTSVLDIDELLNVILDVALTELEAERGTVFLLDRERGEIFSRILRGEEIDEIRMPLGKGISGSVAQTGETVIIQDAYADERFDPNTDKRSGFRTRSILCAPLLKGGEEVVGVLQLLNKRDGAFSEIDAEYLSALAAHMVIALENARAHLERLEQERTRRELELAAQIQQRFLPQSTPQAPGLAIDARAIPCSEVGGDYYDFLELPGGALGVVIADVSGHGIPAALITTAIHAYLHALIDCYEDPASLASRLNSLLHFATPASKYATMAVVEYDPAKRRLRYCNCGHNPLILIRNGKPEKLGACGTVVGMFPVAKFVFREIELRGGERLLLYTDGVTEASRGADDGREEFGLERLQEVSLEASGEPSDWIDTVVGSVESFTSGEPLDDDLTMVAMRFGKLEDGGDDGVVR